MKKTLLSFLSLLIVFCMTFTCFAGAAFADVQPDTTEGGAVSKLAEAGIINGFPDGLFHAERSLTRAQFCKIANKVFGYTEKGTETFVDVPATFWGAEEISIAQKAGYIKGVGNGKFNPDGALTREQVCIMLVRILGYEPLPFAGTISDPISSWAEQDVKTALAYYIFMLEAGNKFRAQQAITRGEVSVVLSRYLKSDTPIVKPDSEFVLTLKELSQAFAELKTTNAEAKVLEPLKACIDKAIAEADSGKDVTEETVASLYASELSNIRKIYHAMNSSDVSAMKLKIAKLVKTKTATLLYNTFLTAPETPSGGGGGGGGGGGAGGSGDSGSSDDNTPEPFEGPVVDAIRTIVAELGGMVEDEEFLAYELPVVEPLLDCLEIVLEDAAAGTEITKAHVKNSSTYRGYIDDFNSGYNGLSKTDKTALRTKLVNQLDDEAADLLCDYFLDE